MASGLATLDIISQPNFYDDLFRHTTELCEGMQQVADDSMVQQRFSALADGASVVGSYQTRNAATIGGNVCNAAPSADTSPPLAVLGAHAHVAGVNGERELPVEQLWVGPGQTVLEPGEIVTAFIVPAPPAGAGSHYARHTPRKNPCGFIIQSPESANQRPIFPGPPGVP